jgi:hypothetical protein
MDYDYWLPIFLAVVKFAAIVATPVFGVLGIRLALMEKKNRGSATAVPWARRQSWVARRARRRRLTRGEKFAIAGLLVSAGLSAVLQALEVGKERHAADAARTKAAADLERSNNILSNAVSAAKRSEDILVEVQDTAKRSNEIVKLAERASLAQQQALEAT